MIKHKRAFYANDEEYEILKAAAKRRSVSEYVLSCAMGAAKRHTPVEELSAHIRRIVREELKDCFPRRGNANYGGLRAD